MANLDWLDVGVSVHATVDRGVHRVVTRELCFA